MKKIVISGINLYSGGTLSIFRDCLQFASKELVDEYEIVAFVHKKELFSDINDIDIIEIPTSRRSWVARIYYEYFFFRKWSKDNQTFLWFSIHDMTPNVIAKKKCVYCHNPMPFYQMSFQEKKIDKKLALFNKFYKYLYKINIKKNDFVIVQQDWIRNEFSKLYNIRKDNIIVARPNVPEVQMKEATLINCNRTIQFFYPTFPRVFKNIELICEAVKVLVGKGLYNFEVIITISGFENKYANWIYNKYKNISQIKFIGVQSRENVYKYYSSVTALIFPSKLETWGLPITEFKSTKKPIIISNLEYAKETLGDYDKCMFFDKESENQLATIMEKIIKKDKVIYCKNKLQQYNEPFSNSWKELFDILLIDVREDK